MATARERRVEWMRCVRSQSVLLFAIGLTPLLHAAMSSPSQAAEAVAAMGRPFGVARVTLPLPSKNPSLDIATNGYEIKAPEGRVFYPAFAHRRVLGVLRKIVGIPDEVPSSVTLFFLFQGNTPFQMTVHTPHPERIDVVPRSRPRLHQRLLQNWWEKYRSIVRLQRDEGDYPPVVETYLSTMLRQRLGLPASRNQQRRDRQTIQQESLRLVLNAESLRLQAMKDTLEGKIKRGPAEQPLPSGIDWQPRSIPVLDASEIEMEPIASRVPDDCFYIRFGNFDNYIWLRKFLETNGGSAGQLIFLRGHDPQLSQKTQAQLGLKDTKLAEILGNRLISDVAIIGHDTYLREGAAIGILFEAKTSLLKNELLKQRQQAVQAQQQADATIEEITILDSTVSFAHSPGNQLRSFQVNADNYYLVTNSRYLAKQFLNVSQQQVGALSDSDHFRLARQRFPLSNEATVFGFLSPSFFRHLVSPHYQIELRRRLRAVTDIELVRLARFAAIHEGREHGTVEHLVEHALLPSAFQQRVDDSRVVMEGEHVYDSLRGKRGHFLPIRDVPITAVSESEVRTYHEITRFHQQHWQNMDPLVFEVTRRQMEDDDRERIDLRGEMLPFDRNKYGLITSVIGPARSTRIRHPEGDAVTLQMTLQGGRLRPGVGTHHLFFGLQDKQIPVQFADEPWIRYLQVLRSAPAYLGAWPQLGLLDLPLLSRAQGATAEGDGLSQLPLGLWRLETPDRFALIGTDPRVLEEAARELAVEEGSDTAQIRLHIKDVSQSKIKTWFAAMDFQRAYQTSRGNTRLMHALSQQLGVPQQEAKQAAEQVLGVDLVCALGGEYKLFEAHGRQFWGSTNWPTLRSDPSKPGQFAAPSMAWFRGMDAQVTMLPDRATGQATIEVKPIGDKTSLPFFDFFE